MQFPMASSEVLAAAAAEVPVEVAQQTEVRSTLQCFRLNVQDQVQNAAFLSRQFGPYACTQLLRVNVSKVLSI